MRAFSLIAVLVFTFLVPKAEAMRMKGQMDKMLSNPSYEKHIDVKCYVVTRKQISDLLGTKEKSVVQLSTKELQHPLEVYFLIRVKNNGNMAASGMLNCFVPCCGYPFPVKVMEMPPKMKDYYDFIIRFDAGLIRPTDPRPVVTYEWAKLDCCPIK